MKERLQRIQEVFNQKAIGEELDSKVLSDGVFDNSLPANSNSSLLGGSPVKSRSVDGNYRAVVLDSADVQPEKLVNTPVSSICKCGHYDWQHAIWINTVNWKQFRKECNGAVGPCPCERFTTVEIGK